MTTKKSKRVIVNLSTPQYSNSVKRLKKSLEKHWGGDTLFFESEAEVGSPLHSENPYAFKIYAFLEAMRQGYMQILWLDSSVYAVKNIRPVFKEIKEKGYIMQYNGWNAAQWCNDKCLDSFNLTRDEAEEIPLYGDAGFLGIDMQNEKAFSFFYKWMIRMEEGLFKGNWDNKLKTESEDERCLGHRHDLSVGSIIADSLGMKLSPNNYFLQYASPEQKVNKSVIFKAQGIN